jgi:hypothetical protein
MTFIFRCFLFLKISAFTLQAHVGFENETEVGVYPDRTEVLVRTSHSLANRLLGDTAAAVIDADHQQELMPRLTELGRNLFTLSDNGEVLEPLESECFFELDQDIAFKVSYRSVRSWPLVLHARFIDRLGPLDGGRISVFHLMDASGRCADHEPIAGKILTPERSSLEVIPGPLVTDSALPTGSAPTPAERAPYHMPIAVALVVGIGGICFRLFH